LTWRDAASVRIKLKVPATQRHHRERAALDRWLPISQVRFLYGLSRYTCMLHVKIFLIRLRTINKKLYCMTETPFQQKDTLIINT